MAAYRGFCKKSFAPVFSCVCVEGETHISFNVSILGGGKVAPQEPDAPPPKRPKTALEAAEAEAPMSFAELQTAGYRPVELLEPRSDATGPPDCPPSPLVQAVDVYFC